ncbi:hypothetical protein QBC34DRAFT_485402 [Podospora aff. communis PSN243]|uniref:Rhodopsin domain-containing protein n=1 Tax=Podospora aff. communis PSN243 TaxID=3040156 RepID=A0AAV9GMX6_9PEZI|nr:hypothetical protein QBC34DRAFT_485402 [Podospora aff. communis PSN243]
MASDDSGGALPHRSLLALVWTCFSVAAVLVVLRTVTRLKYTVRRLTGEDYCMFVALAALLTQCTLETIQLPSLFHITAVLAGTIPLSAELITQTEQYLRLEFAIIILFWSVLWCVKASFLALYFKLFRELVLYRRVWYLLASFTALAYGGCVITLCLSCGHISNFFKFGQCAKAEYIWASNLSVYYSTAIDVFTDLCIMAMPLRLIYNVKVSPKQKLGLVCVFGLCFVMIAFAIIRAKQVLVQQQFVNLKMLMIWSTLTASISVIVGSLPALKILITNRPATKHSLYASGGGAKKQYSHGSNRSNGVPLGSISSEKRSIKARRTDTSDSQEEILQQDSGRFVMVKHDITVSFDDVDHPRPTFPSRLQESEYGRAV